MIYGGLFVILAILVTKAGHWTLPGEMSIAMALLVVVVFKKFPEPAEVAIRTFAFCVWQLSECR
jgi:hypothetical protein